MAADKLIKLLDDALDAAERARPPRPSIGPSSIGSECSRRVSYEYFEAIDEQQRYAAEKEDYLAPQRWPAHMLRTFRDGNTLEKVVLDDLELAGFSIERGTPDGKQHGFVASMGRKKRRFAGRVDGIITKAPEGLDFKVPFIVDVKTMNSKNWEAFVKKGAAEAHKRYVYQLNIYMGFMGLMNPSMLIAYNKDTSRYHVEMIEFDQRVFDDAVHEIEALLDADDPTDLPRGGGSIEVPPCKFCRFAEQCWAAMPTVKLASVIPDWVRK